ncbi:PREDICTED: nucleoside diphosphate kinase-like isoform X2 [Branchiostoma belcheri]|uniref:Nucleoside diphosphate kinase n=1 Tax=Branchiostoma belcheri TaxID=7741 RepID=A0A6P4XY09_BRABE|nr:PREDICTED: nucleoside diphosphate kinase-like isoform X2 [Branchiostoma belcheri]
MMIRYAIIYACSTSRARNAGKPWSCSGLAYRAMSTKVPERNKERSFIMIKPNGVQRGLIGEVIKRFEQKGYKLVAMKFMQASEEHMQKHYTHLQSKAFYPGLCKYMSSSPVVPMGDSLPGTIRGDFCLHVGRNLVHGSDSIENANKEIALWFREDEIVTYTAGQYDWVYDD